MVLIYSSLSFGLRFLTETNPPELQVYSFRPKSIFDSLFAWSIRNKLAGKKLVRDIYVQALRCVSRTAKRAQSIYWRRGDIHLKFYELRFS